MAFGVNPFFHRRYAPAWLTLALGLAASAGLGWGLHREAVALDRQRLAMRVAEIQSHFDARLEKSEMLLNNLRDYLTWSRESREKIFQRWCYENGLTINCPWILGIAVATNRHAPQWQAYLPKPKDTWTEDDRMNLDRLARSNSFDCDIALTSKLNGKHFLADYGLRRSL